MAYRTSLPLHPTEFKEEHKVKVKRKGVKTKSLGKKKTEAKTPNQAAKISKETLRLKKTRSKSGKPTKIKAKSVSKVTTGANTKTKADDSTKYVVTKSKQGKPTKVKQVSQKKYSKVKKRLKRKYDR